MVVIVVFDGMTLLDVAGAGEAFVEARLVPPSSRPSDFRRSGPREWHPFARDRSFSRRPAC